MKYVTVIGNGESRKSFDLYQLEWLGTTIGTNAVHRDFHPDHLVCCDRRMVQEAVNNSYENPVYTRSDWYKQFSFWRNVRCLPELPYEGNKRQDDPWHWGSGGHALNLACNMNPEFVVMIGFDLFASNNNLFNNVYKSTENYNDASKPPTDPSYWIYQTAKLFELYPNIKFLQIQLDDWNPPKEWEDFDNFFIDNYENLQILIDKTK
jgi:hypothetical protein